MNIKSAKPSIKLLPAPSLLHSGLEIGGQSLWLKVKRFTTPAHLLAAGVGVYLLLSTAFTAAFFLPRTVNFSYSSSNCFTSPILLPNLVAKNQGKTFEAVPAKSLTIAGYPIYSQTTCVTPVQPPSNKASDNISFSPMGVGFLKKNIHISAGTLPAVSYRKVLSAPVPTQDPITFRLTDSDRFFEYQLVANGHKSACDKNNGELVCSTNGLVMEQSANYTLSMQRLFNGQPYSTVFEQLVTTVGAVQLAASSIAPGQTVYDVPSQMTLTLSKEIKSFSGAELSLVSGSGRKKIPVTADVAGQIVTVHFTNPLARDSSFELTINKITASDGGHLPAPLVLAFTTSGGPKVKGVSIGSYKVSTTGNIVLTFDSNISPAQNPASFVKLDIANVGYTVSRNGNTVTVHPSSAMPKCTYFTVRVLDGLQNEFGISGGSAWQYKARTICQTAFSIGTSVKGRGITGYRFGSGASNVVFVGGTHGNEKSGVYTLNSWVDYLEKNYDQIPANRTIVVIPNLNPDGYNSSTRTNANNVDLNRNFPANNWKQGVTMPGGSFNSNGGGAYPLSEPESNSIANYLVSLSPRLVLTYHATAGVVMPNDSGDSVALAQTYDQKSNLNYEPSSQTDEIFTYDTTGSMEEWLYDKYDIPTLLVELWTLDSNEFSKNQNAMIYMAQLP